MTAVVVEKTLEVLYAGTLDTAAWNRAIVGIADLVHASGAQLLAINPDNGTILRDESHRVDPGAAEDYARHWTYEDCRRDYLLSVPVGRPVTELSLSIADFGDSRILNEFLLPVDAPHFMPAWLHKSTTKMVALSLLGTRKRGAFGAEDMEVFRRILPHVSRALEIRDRLEAAQIRAETLATSLSGLSVGVMVLVAVGKLLEVNAVAQELLRKDSGVQRKADGTLGLREPAGSQLARWLASGKRPARGIGGLLHVCRAGARPLSVTVSPLPERSSAWMSGEPRWLLLIFDPERRVDASRELIARDLCISPREAEVAALLVAGYSLREIARQLIVSEHTVRGQLKSIFRKTGARTQSDLVRRIVLGPALLPRDPEL
ncbi:MAG: LuxR C-terminal-related transcriptional regulator [Steroidobacteraceae bacterium]